MFVNPPDADAILALFQAAAAKAIAVLHETGEYQPTMTLGCCPPGAREMLASRYVPPKFVQELHHDSVTKALLRELIQDTLNPDTPLHRNASATLGAEVNVVIHITESWISRPVASAPFVPPSEDPERTEALTVIIHSGRGTAVGICPITRDANGHPTAVIGEMIGPQGELQGNLVTNPLHGVKPRSQTN